jgi:hypothetical protein
MLVASSLALAEDTATRRYELAGHGFLRMVVPKSWHEEVRQPAQQLPPTIVFTPKSGSAFQILLTPIFAVQQGMVMPTPWDVRRNVERAVEIAKGHAVEETVLLRELRGPSVIGYYFSVTDRAPKHGEFKHMTQGMFRVGDLAPTFTILTNDGAGNVVADALAMLKGAVHTPKAP